MPVSEISSVLNSGAAPVYQPGADRVPKKTLGQDEFFKLIAVQFASQDPLKPMEDTAFIAQLANFSALENSNKLASEFGRLARQQELSGAQALLGRTVTLRNENDTEVSGVVTAVRSDGDAPLITVNGADYAVGTVRRVEINNPATDGDQP